MPAYDPSLWQPLAASPVLAAGEIHIWRACLMQPDERVAELTLCLSEDERQRALRYRFEGDRRRFVVARGLLRRLLQHYLGVAAQELVFCYGMAGKPQLALPQVNLQFNLSHSREVLLIALGFDCELGIDLEVIRPLPGFERLAERNFALGEKQALALLPPTERQERFFRIWVCKEAYIKALGQGLALALDQFAVAIAPAGEVRLSAGQTGQWSLQQLNPGKDYVAALAVRGTLPPLRCWQWQDDYFEWDEDCHRASCQTYG